jgi:phosphatidylglycerol lysyltransferase
VTERERAFELIRRHGRTTVSFQALESGIDYWFSGDDAVVAYADTGSAWVAAGGPIGPPHRISQVAEHFADEAAGRGRRACFFCAEQPLVDLGFPAMQIGEQPVWTVARWDESLAGSQALRYQLSRARRKGVTIRRVVANDLAETSPLRAACEQLAQQWQQRKNLPPMQFLVRLEPLLLAQERLLFVAEREGDLVGLASAVPIYARDRLFLEDLLRAANAPNGTSELLVDAVMRASDVPEVTLGLAPLTGGVPRWLQLARWLGGPLYDFAGLRSFKAKLRPHAWEPVYLCAGPGGALLEALRDSLRAFAGGSLLAFAARAVIGR